MNMKTAITTCFEKFFTIKGRASRSEYWWFILFTAIVALLLFFFGDYQFFWHNPYLLEIRPFATLWTLIACPALICVSVRRLHDINRTGWWILSWNISVAMMFIGGNGLNLITDYKVISNFYLGLFSALLLVGAVSHFGHMIIIFIFNCLKGTKGDNRFGKDPLAE